MFLGITWMLLSILLRDQSESKLPGNSSFTEIIENTEEH